MTSFFLHNQRYVPVIRPESMPSAEITSYKPLPITNRGRSAADHFRVGDNPSRIDRMAARCRAAGLQWRHTDDLHLWHRAYEIQSALDAGGTGNAYRALDTKLRRDVALKILPETFRLYQCCHP
jgi:hypothetical protein